MGKKQKERYAFETSKEVYTFFKAIFIKKRISFGELVEDSKKSKSVVSLQIKPLLDKGIVSVFNEEKTQKTYYEINEKMLFERYLKKIQDELNPKVNFVHPVLLFTLSEDVVLFSKNFNQLDNFCNSIASYLKEIKEKDKKFSFRSIIYPILWE